MSHIPLTPKGMPRKAIAEQGSPQQLIKQFLRENLPDFPSMFDETQATGSFGISGFSGGGSVAANSTSFSAFSRASSEADEDTDSYQLSVDEHLPELNESSVALSLPDSFDASYFKQLDTLAAVTTNKKGHNKTAASGGHCSKCVSTRQTHEAERSRAQQIESELRKEHAILQSRVSTLEMELQQAKKLHAMTDEGLQLEVKTLEDRCKRLNALYEAEAALRIQNEEKAKLFVVNEEELKKLRAKVAEQQLMLEQQRVTVDALSQSEFQQRKTAEDADRVKDLLQLDKIHLQQEVQLLERKYQDALKSSEEERSRALSHEVKVSQLTDQILSLQMSSRSQFDDKMEKEIIRLREESQREMDNMKLTSKEIIDRENRTLRETKDSLEMEIQQSRRRNESLSSELSALQRELHTMQHEKNAEINELRAELKMKSFELTTLSVNYEERMQQLRHVELEAGKAQQEIHIHKSALLRMESEVETQRQHFQHQLDQANVKLQAYEALEVEIDQAVLRAAAIEDGNDLHQRDWMESQAIMKVARGIPSSPERRVKQAVFLAQRLLETERQRDDARQQIKDMLQGLEAVKQEKEQLNVMLSRAAQPTAYLVNKLREEEVARIQLAEQCNVLKDEVAKLRRVCHRKEEECEDVKDRLKMLLQQRGELQTVKQMIQHLQDIDEEEEEEEESDLDDEEPPVYEEAVEEKKMATPPREVKDSASSPLPKKSFTPNLAHLGLSPDVIKRMTTPPSIRQQHLTGGPSSSAGRVVANEMITSPYRTAGNNDVPGIVQLSYTKEILDRDQF